MPNPTPRRAKDPLEGLDPEVIDLLNLAKKEQEAAWKSDDAAKVHRERFKVLCNELRTRGVGVERMGRYFGVSPAYIWQITKEEVSVVDEAEESG